MDPKNWLSRNFRAQLKVTCAEYTVTGDRLSQFSSANRRDSSRTTTNRGLRPG